jgi:hypothetical protein
MFKNLLVIILTGLTLVSCSKDSDKDDNNTPVYSLSAKIDGVSQAFNLDLGAGKAGDATYGYTVVVIGRGGTASNIYPTLTVQVRSDATIVAKTYTAANGEASAVYVAADQTTYVGVSEFTVTISSITDTEMSGTFSGKVDDGSGGLKTISEGTFSAKFI